MASNRGDRDCVVGVRVTVAMWVASAGSGSRATFADRPLGGPASTRFSGAQPREMCISRSNGSIAPMVPDRSANSSMRSPVTVNSHGWVLWALAADRGPDEIQWVVSRRVRLILAAVAPARADTACGQPRPSAKTRGGTDPHRPSGTRRVEGFMSTIQPSPGPERDLGDEHWQCRGIGSGDTVPKPAVVVSAIDPTRRAGPAGVA